MIEQYFDLNNLFIYCIHLCTVYWVSKIFFSCFLTMFEIWAPNWLVFNLFISMTWVVCVIFIEFPNWWHFCTQCCLKISFFFSIRIGAWYWELLSVLILWTETGIDTHPLLNIDMYSNYLLEIKKCHQFENISNSRVILNSDHACLSWELMSFQSANNHLQSVSTERQAAPSFFPKWQYDNAAPLSISMAAMDWPFKQKPFHEFQYHQHILAEISKN